jgi:hypothetical protein
VARCRQCEGTLHKSEVQCLQCGAPVGGDPNKVSIQERICGWLKIAVILSCVLTAASIFLDFTPSFTKCSVTTLILGLAKSSADEMWDRS